MAISDLFKLLLQVTETKEGDDLTKMHAGFNAMVSYCAERGLPAISTEAIAA